MNPSIPTPERIPSPVNIRYDMQAMQDQPALPESQPPTADESVTVGQVWPEREASNVDFNGAIDKFAVEDAPQVVETASPQPNYTKRRVVAGGVTGLLIAGVATAGPAVFEAGSSAAGDVAKSIMNSESTTDETNRLSMEDAKVKVNYNAETGTFRPR